MCNSSAPPKSSWHARLKEHKGVPSDKAGYIGGENWELAYPPRVYCMCGQILDHLCREAVNQKSRSHKSSTQWLAPQWVVDGGSLQHYWCCLFCT